MSNSYSTGSVTGGYRYRRSGGSEFRCTVSNSYSTGSVTGEDFTGRLVGINGKGSTVSNSYSTGSVTCAGHVCVAGGLVGV